MGYSLNVIRQWQALVRVQGKLKIYFRDIFLSLKGRGGGGREREHIIGRKYHVSLPTVFSFEK